MGMATANPTDRHETLSWFLGSQTGESGFPNGDCGVHSGVGRFALRPSGFLVGLVDSTHNMVGSQWEKWVPKWGNLGSQMGMAIAHPTDRRETLSCFLGSQIGKSWFTNGDCWVLSGAGRCVIVPSGFSVGLVDSTHNPVGSYRVK
jgi:hypothetical protein